MKKIILLAMSVFLLTNAVSAQNPTVENPGFENGWNNITITSLPPLNTMEVNAWNCSDALISSPDLLMTALRASLGIEAKQQIFQSTDAYSDSFALELRTEALNDTIIVPGIVANAKMNLNLQGGELGDIAEMFSFTNGALGYGKKIDTVRAWVKLDTANVDDAMITLTAYQVRDGQSMEIGFGTGTIVKDTIYQQISFGIDYMASNNTATDTFVISIFSSVPNMSGEMTAGNTLLVDDVSLEYSEGERAVSVKQYSLVNNMVNVYPVPATNVLYFDISNTASLESLYLTIYDMNGRIIEQQKVAGFVFSKDLSAYASGNYIYNLKDNKSNTAQNGKFIVE